MKDYKYEIAFSLCKEDIEYAKNLKNEITDSLVDKIFLYTENQNELITKIGPEKFREVFLIESRIVVVLYRKEYGKTYYTGLEKEAIIERTGQENQGIDFIFLIPMVKNQIPNWYSKSRIYADPFNFAPYEIARFIEFKVVNQDGIINPLTFKEEIESLNNSLIKKKEKIKLLNSNTLIKNVEQQISDLIDIFYSRRELISSYTLPFSITKGNDSLSHYVGIGNFILELRIEDKNIPNAYWGSASSYRIRLSIYTKQEFDFQNIDTKKESIDQIYFRFNFENNDIFGWSIEESHGENIDPTLHPYFYKCVNNFFYYKVSRFFSNEDLIEEWFKKLLKIVRNEFEIKLK